MALFDTLRGLLLKNPIQADHIVVNGAVKNIHIDEVSLPEIFLYFKEKLPTVHWEIGDAILSIKDPAELAKAKRVLYSNLAAMLEQTAKVYNGSCYPKDSNSKEWYEARDKTIH